MMRKSYEASVLSRAELELIKTPLVLEFGASWCGHCMAAQPHIERAFSAFPNLQHVLIEDGPGRPLGRSFKVKLWPTLIFINNAQEIARLIRPTAVAEIDEALALLLGERSF